jgi:peroxiredoxin
MKSRLTLLLTLISLIFFWDDIHAQDNYKITVNVSGMPDTIAFLGSYYGESMTVEDTAIITDQGKVVFQDNQELDAGVYFLVDQEKIKLFEFIVDNSRNFELSTDTIDFINNMKVKGSSDNEVFFEYQQTSSQLFNKILELRQMKSRISNQDSMNWVDEQINAVNEQNVTYKLEFIENHPDHILTLIFKASREPEIPDSLKGDSREQRKKAYQYYKNHFWDNVDLTDPRIIKTPIFHNIVEKYFNQVVPKNPDSIIHEIDKIMDICKANAPVYEYLAWYFTATYESASIMGYDKIFVHMVDNYFRGKRHDWVSETMYENLVERADRIKPILIGNYAPELILIDTNDQFKSLYELNNDYVIIFFWTTTCSECKREIKHLEELYTSNKIDMEIFAVNTDTSLAIWKDFISDRSLNWINVNGTRSISKDYHILYDIYKTPTIFVIDKDKKIIAKYLAAEQIIGFVEKHEKFIMNQK